MSEEAPNVAAYLSDVALNNVQISRMLTWGEENKASAVETAENFLKTEADIWTAWVSEDIAAAVQAAL